MQIHSLTALEIALGASQIEKAIGLPSMPLNALGRGKTTVLATLYATQQK
jgi:hypothetical protein